MKIRVSLKKRVMVIAVLMLAVSITVLGQTKTYALDSRQELVLSSVGYAYTHYGEDVAYSELIASEPSTEVVQKCVDAVFSLITLRN